MGSHLGEEKTLSRLKERFSWPGHWSKVGNWCRACTSCATRKIPAPRRRAPLQNIHSGSPMQIVAMDIMGAFPPSRMGNIYSRGGTPLHKMDQSLCQEASTVAEKLTDEWFVSVLQDSLNPVSSQVSTNYFGLSRQGPPPIICSQMVLLSVLIVPYSPCTKEHPGDWEDYFRKVSHTTPASIKLLVTHPST